MSVASRRNVLGTLALVLTSLIVGLLVPEIALRVMGYVPARFPSMARMANARWTELLDCYPTNPRGYFDIDLRIPENHDRYFHLAPLRFDRVSKRAPWAVAFRYNAQKFREKPLQPKRPDVRRVMVLGDSFTEGQGVKEEDTLVRRLERALRGARNEPWEVLNCGRRGTDFPALQDAFEDAFAFGVDVFVYAFVLNDAEQSPAFHARQSYLDDWILDRGAMLEADPPSLGFFEPRLCAFVTDRVTSYRVGRETTRWYLEMYDEPNREGWERTQADIRAMNQRVRASGARFILMSWPLLVGLEGRYPFAPIHEKVRRFCVKEGIEHLDLLDTLRGRPSTSLWVHPVDRHPNEVANRLAAEALLPVVRRER